MLHDFIIRFSEIILPEFSITLVEVGILSAEIIVFFIAGKILEKKSKHLIKQQDKIFNKTLLLRCTKLIPPSVIALALSLTNHIVHDVLNVKSMAFFYAQNFMLAWLTAQFLLIVLRRNTAIYLILLIIFPLAILLNQQLWDNILFILDSWTFKVGTVRISFFQIFKSLLVAVFLYWSAKKILHIAESNIDKVEFIRPSLRALAIKFLQIFLYIIFSLWLLNIIGVPLTSLAVFGGAIGIGIGFGIQRIVANFISGLIILMEETLKKNDIVELEDSSFGSIKKTHARYTLVETFDGKEIFIPNEEFITKRVTNWTYSHKRIRQSIMIGVAYESDLQLAQNLMLEAVQEHSGIAKSPEPHCHLLEFGDSSVNFMLRFWFNRIDFNIYLPRSELLFAIWRKFKDAGIEFPYPQQDIHIRSVSDKNSTQSIPIVAKTRKKTS